MKTYIINLASAPDRRQYMEQLLGNYPQLDFEFINAVNGKQMSIQQQDTLFDLDKFIQIYQYPVRPGEIGCTLSHQKCYRHLVESYEKSAIIFEDDLIVNEPVKDILPLIQKWLDCDEPRVLLLSGWFWFTSSSNFDKTHEISRVVDGYLTHAYALNRAAAKVMLDSKPWYVADAWRVFIKRGVKIYGLRPHLFDQDWGPGFQTAINTESRMYLPFNKGWIRIKYRSLIQHTLSLFGKFEKARK